MPHIILDAGALCVVVALCIYTYLVHESMKTSTTGSVVVQHGGRGSALSEDLNGSF